MSPSQYLHELLCALHQHCSQQPPFNAEALSETDQGFLDRLQALTNTPNVDENHYQEGQQLVAQVVANYPHITPLMSRDLLWLLGGDALHFLGDDEISFYQQLEDSLYSKPDADFKTLKAQLQQQSKQLH